MRPAKETSKVRNFMVNFIYSKLRTVEGIILIRNRCNAFNNHGRQPSRRKVDSGLTLDAADRFFLRKR